MNYLLSLIAFCLLISCSPEKKDNAESPEKNSVTAKKEGKPAKAAAAKKPAKPEKIWPEYKTFKKFSFAPGYQAYFAKGQKVLETTTECFIEKPPLDAVMEHMRSAFRKRLEACEYSESNGTINLRHYPSFQPEIGIPNMDLMSIGYETVVAYDKDGKEIGIEANGLRFSLKDKVPVNTIHKIKYKITSRMPTEMTIVDLGDFKLHDQINKGLVRVIVEEITKTERSLKFKFGFETPKEIKRARLLFLNKEGTVLGFKGSSSGNKHAYFFNFPNKKYEKLHMAIVHAEEKKDFEIEVFPIWEDEEADEKLTALYTEFRKICEKKDLAKVKEFLDKNKILLEKCNPSFGDYPLHTAASVSSAEVCEYVLKLSPGINIRNGFSLHTPLSSAILGWNKETFKFLMDKGADVTMKFSCDDTNGHIQVRHTGDSPLTRASKTSTEMAMALIKKGADIHYHSEDDYLTTPLIAASYGKEEELVKYLLEKGVAVNAVNKKYKGKTALDYAVEQKADGIIKLLKTKGAKTFKELYPDQFK